MQRLSEHGGGAIEQLAEHEQSGTDRQPQAGTRA